MSFFENLLTPVSFAIIDGVKGDPLSSIPGFESAVQLNNIDFSFNLQAEPTNFNKLFSQEVGKSAVLDYDPSFSLAVETVTGADQKALLAAVDNNTQFKTIEIVTLAQDFEGRFVEYYRHSLEDARFYSYGVADGGTPRFGLAFDQITLKMTPVPENKGSTSEAVSYEAQFDENELAAANPKFGNIQVEQGVFVDGNGPDDEPDMFIELFDGSFAKNPFEDIDPIKNAKSSEAFTFNVEAISHAVARGIADGRATSQFAADINILEFEIGTLNRASLAELAQQILTDNSGHGMQFQSFSPARADEAPLPTFELQTESDFYLGGLTFGGDETQLVTGGFGKEVTSKMFEINNEGNKSSPLQETTYDARSPSDLGARGSFDGIADGYDAFFEIEGITGDTERKGEDVFNLIDFEVSFSRDVFFVGGSTGTQVSPRPDFSTLVLEINAYTEGNRDLLESLVKNTYIPEAKLELVKEPNGNDPLSGFVTQKMEFTGLSVLSMGMGLNNNTMVELGYDGWKLTTSGGKEEDNKLVSQQSVIDFTPTLQSSRLNEQGKFLSSTMLDSDVQVGSGSTREGRDFDAFFKTSTIEGNATAQDYKGQVDVADFEWRAYREDGALNVSDLGLALDPSSKAHPNLLNANAGGETHSDLVLTVVSDELAETSFEALKITAKAATFTQLTDVDGTGLGLGVRTASEVSTGKNTQSLEPGATFTWKELTQIGTPSGALVADTFSPSGGPARHTRADLPTLPEDGGERLFLYLDGVTGQVTSKEAEGFDGWIEIDSYGLEFLNQQDPASGFVGVKPSASALGVHLDPNDPALAVLLKNLSDNVAYDEMKLARVFDGGNSEDAIRYEFKDARLLTMLEQSGKETALEFAYDSVQLQTIVSNATSENSTIGGPVAYDYANNVAKFTGDGTPQHFSSFSPLDGPDDLERNLLYFLKFTGLPDDVGVTKGFEDYVEIEDYVFDLSSLSGATQKGLTIAPITVSGPIEESLFDLLETTNKGQGFAEMEIVVALNQFEASGPQQLHKIELKNVYIQNLSHERADSTSMNVVFSNLDYTAGTIDTKTGAVTSETFTLDLARDDYVTGSPKDDRFDLGDGDDTANAATGKGDDFFDGGKGTDTLLYLSAVSGAVIDLSATENNAFSPESDTDTIINVENLILGPGDDDITGNDDDNLFEGNQGADTLRGLGGDDTLNGGSGDDSILGGENDDHIEGGIGADAIDGGLGTDTAIYTQSSAGISLRLNGSIGSGGEAQGDRVVDIENLEGSSHADSVIGNEADNLLSGGGSNDTLFGATGNDTLIGDVGADSLRGNGGLDSIEGGVGNDRINGDEGDDTLHGGADDDRVLGGNDNDLILGEDGDDSGFGQAGRDTLLGGIGNDTLAGNRGADELFGGDGDDSLLGNEAPDSLHGEAGADTLFGGSGKDVLFGGAENDVLNGGSSGDTLTGGTGSDIFVFSNPGGIDRVTDFENGVDLLDFTAAGVGFGTLSLATFGGGAGTRLQANGYTVFLEGIDISLIDASDFV